MTPEGKILLTIGVVGAAFVVLKQEWIPTLAVKNVTDKLANAIATAEGFYVKDSRAARNNNPGNLTVDIQGGPRAVGRDGPFVVYATAADGWADLKEQVRLMLTGGSKIYQPTMSILEVASRYTATQQAEWAANVASTLGVPSSTKLGELSA